VHAAIAENRQVVVTHGRTWRLIDPGARPPWVQVSGDISTDMFAQRVNDARIFAGHLGIWRAAVDSNERTCLSASNTSNVCIDEPSDRLLASGYAGDIVMHSLASGEIKWTYQKEDLGTPVVALWKDVAFVGGSDSTVTALDAATGMIRWTRQDQRYRVRDISTAAGRVASASSSPGIVVYDMNGEQQALCRFVDARCVALSPDAEQFISGSDRGTIAVGTASSRAPTSEIPAHAGGVWSVAINPTGTLAASGGGDGIVRLWWLNPLTPIASFPISQEQSSLVLDVRFSEDSRRLSCSLISQGAYEIDLAQHEHALDDWLTRDLAYASSGHTVGSGTDTFSNDNDEGQ
jgi:WD40 repeat protein